MGQRRGGNEKKRRGGERGIGGEKGRGGAKEQGKGRGMKM